MALVPGRLYGDPTRHGLDAVRVPHAMHGMCMSAC